MNHFSLMARFNAWVNDRLYDSVSGLSRDAYKQDRKAFFGSIHNTLNHLLVVDRLFSGRIQGTDRGIRGVDQILCDDFERLRAARISEDEALVAMVDGLSPAQLESPVTYRRMVGDATFTTRCDHLLLTLYNHQTHHRGQVHAMLTQAEVIPPPLDVIYFLPELGLS